MQRKGLMAPFELSSKQKNILCTSGNLLILGGPGSGKTTIAILKADRLIGDQTLPTQKTLFLSFARSTVSRVTEVLKQHSLLTEETKRCIDVDTYHAFFWRIIKTHGYLLGLPRKLSILPPQEEAILLSGIRSNNATSDNLKALRTQFAYKEGKICFDLFACLAAHLVRRSQKIRRLISVAFPIVILDEFQDTNAEQWCIVKELGRNSTLIALADPEQSIYGFTGANPDRRISDYREYTRPSEFNLTNANHRSTETDIVAFGKDILKGRFRKSAQYNGIKIIDFKPNKNQAFYALKLQIKSAQERLTRLKPVDWSLAVLAPTKKMMAQISDILDQSAPKIAHHASTDVEGSLLASEILAFLLQPEPSKYNIREFLRLLLNFFLGRGGGADPAKTDLYEGKRIENTINRLVKCKNNESSLPKNSIIYPISRTYQKCLKFDFLGNPEKDWSNVICILQESDCNRLKKVAEEAKRIKILGRGTQLREALVQSWMETGAYTDALNITRESLTREHFARSKMPKTGITVMNMHKAKGHQFDEVIIFEGWPLNNNGSVVSNPDRIVQGNSNNFPTDELEQAKKNLYVSITRAKVRTTIMTPKNNRCILLPERY